MGIEHRLTQFKHSWTNGQSRAHEQNLKLVTIKTYHYNTLAQFKEHLYHFINAYNYAKKLKSFKFMSPYEIILKAYQIS